VYYRFLKLALLSGQGEGSARREAADQ